MGEKTEPEPAAAVELALREAFAAKAAEPVPESILDHVDRLTEAPPEPDPE